VVTAHAGVFDTWPNVVATVDGLEDAVEALVFNPATADPMP
jgi:hypothetical protein